jgi:hypothetical protein
MRKSGAALAALVSVPVLLAASSALALDITFDQVTGTVGGVALGAVGGPAGGLIGGLLGRAIGRKLHHPPPVVDLTDLKSRPRITPIEDRPLLNEAVEDRAVDSTPIRLIELRPTEADAQTIEASAPRAPPAARTYLASARRHPAHARTYLASARRRAASSPHAIPVSTTRTDAAQPGTLDGQLNQLNARRAAEGLPQIQQIADVR